jgi:hypothetical protein
VRAILRQITLASRRLANAERDSASHAAVVGKSADETRLQHDTCILRAVTQPALASASTPPSKADGSTEHWAHLSPLQIAAREGNAEVLQVLLDAARTDLRAAAMGDPVLRDLCAKVDAGSPVPGGKGELVVDWARHKALVDEAVRSNCAALLYGCPRSCVDKNAHNHHGTHKKGLSKKTSIDCVETLAEQSEDTETIEVCATFARRCHLA